MTKKSDKPQFSMAVERRISDAVSGMIDVVLYRKEDGEYAGRIRGSFTQRSGTYNAQAFCEATEKSATFVASGWGYDKVAASIEQVAVRTGLIQSYHYDGTIYDELNRHYIVLARPIEVGIHTHDLAKLIAAHLAAQPTE